MFGPSIAPNDPLRLPPFNFDEFDADPDPAFHFDADPDSLFTLMRIRIQHPTFDADPDTSSRNYANPLGSGSANKRRTITESTTVVQTLTLHQEQLRPTAGFPNLDPSLDWKCLLQKLHLPCNPNKTSRYWQYCTHFFTLRFNRVRSMLNLDSDLDSWLLRKDSIRICDWLQKYENKL